MNTYYRRYTAHLGVKGDRYCVLPDSFDLTADYESPHSYKVWEVNKHGAVMGNSLRVKVDHEATGTGTAGTGNTVVRRV
jgi:hypothetical protein